MDLSSSRRPFFQSPRLFRRAELPPALNGRDGAKMTSQEPTVTSPTDVTQNLTSSLDGKEKVTSDFQKLPASSLGLLFADDDVMSVESDVRETAILSDSDNSPSQSPRQDDQLPAADNSTRQTGSSDNPDNPENGGVVERPESETFEEAKTGTSEPPGSGSSAGPGCETPDPPGGATPTARRGSGSSHHSDSGSSSLRPESGISEHAGSGNTDPPGSETFDPPGCERPVTSGRGRSERPRSGGGDRAGSTRTVKDVDRRHAISSLRDFRNRVIEFESMRRRPKNATTTSGSKGSARSVSAGPSVQDREVDSAGKNKKNTGAVEDSVHASHDGDVDRNNRVINSKDVSEDRGLPSNEKNTPNGLGHTTSENRSLNAFGVKRTPDSRNDPEKTTRVGDGRPATKPTTFSLVSELRVKYRSANDPVEETPPKVTTNHTSRDSDTGKTPLNRTSPPRQNPVLDLLEGAAIREKTPHIEDKKPSPESSSNSPRSTESNGGGGEEHNKTSDLPINRREDADQLEIADVRYCRNSPSHTETAVHERLTAAPAQMDNMAASSSSHDENKAKKARCEEVLESRLAPPDLTLVKPADTAEVARVSATPLLREQQVPGSSSGLSTSSLLSVKSDSSYASSSSPRAGESTTRPRHPSQSSRSSSEREVQGSIPGVVVQTVCSVCSEEYTAPRILPCLHTFCSRCIAEFVTYPANSGCREGEGSSSSRDSLVGSSTPNGQGPEGGGGVVGEKRVVLCPECVKEVEIPEDMDLLPRNFVVERRLVQMAAQASHSMETLLLPSPPEGDTQTLPAAILVCDCCGEDEASTGTSGGGAMVRCNACRENLCALCEEAHRRQKRTRHHVLHVISPRDVANMAADPVEREIFCPQHSEERLCLFCTSCAVPLCRQCAGSERHRRHKSEPLDGALFQQQMEEVHRLVRQAAPRVAAMETQLRHMSDVRARLHARAKEVEEEVQGFMDSYVEALEQHRKSLVSQVAAILEEKERAIDVTQRHLSDVKTDVERTCRFVSEMLGYGTDLEILSVKGLITERLRRVNALPTKSRFPVTDFLRFCPQQPGDVIHNFQMFGRVLSRQPCPARSCLANDGAITAARVGHKTTLTLLVKDTEGLPYSGSDVSVQAWLIFQNEAQKSVPVSVSNHQDGNYSLTFTPVQQGNHSLHVAVDGQAIKESPMRVGVKGKWREHRGVFQCCTFCHTGGKRDVHCACNARMPGGYLGCGHGHPGHPGGPHWSCCGKMAEAAECGLLFPQRSSPVRQVTL